MISSRVTMTSFTGSSNALLAPPGSVSSAASTSLSSTRPTTWPPSSITGSCDTPLKRMRENTVRSVSFGRTTIAVPSL